MDHRKSTPTQILDFLIGTTPIVAYFGLALLVAFDLPRTPLVYGTMAVAALPGTYLVFGIHELAHVIVADDYCGIRKVYFSTFQDTLLPTLATLVVASGLVLAEMFTGFTIPTWVFLLGIVSPGAVMMKGQSKRSSCSDEVALAGILFGGLPGLLIWWQTDLGIPTPTMEFESLVLSITMVLSLGLTVFNSLPLPRLDGKHVLTVGDPDTVLPLIVYFGLCIGAFLTLF